MLVFLTYHVAAFLAIDVFDKVWDMNTSQCTWLEIHSLIFWARNLLLTSLKWAAPFGSPTLDFWFLCEQELSWMCRMLHFPEYQNISFAEKGGWRGVLTKSRSQNHTLSSVRKHYTVPFILLARLQVVSWYLTVIGKPGYQKWHN